MHPLTRAYVGNGGGYFAALRDNSILASFNRNKFIAGFSAVEVCRIGRRDIVSVCKTVSHGGIEWPGEHFWQRLCVCVCVSGTVINSTVMARTPTGGLCESVDGLKQS